MDALARAVEAALFAAEEPMTAEAIASFLGHAAVGASSLNGPSAGISRQRPIWPISCAGRKSNCAG